MKLRRITAENLKGSSFSVPIADRTAIVGPNFEGKTTVIEAGRISMLGGTPELGKRPSSEMMSGPTAMARSDFDDGSSITTEFKLEGSTVKVRQHTNDGKKPMDEDVDFQTLPLLHAEHYFSLTDTERTNYVFERVKLPDSYTPEAIIAECERISFEEKHTEQIEKAKAEVMTSVRDVFCGDNTIQYALGLLVERLRESFTYWNKRSKETQGAVTTLTELKLREKEVVAAAAGVDGQIADVRRKVEELHKKNGQLTAQKNEADRVKQRQKIIQDYLDADRTDYRRLNEITDEKIKAAEDRRVPVDEVGQDLKGNLENFRQDLKIRVGESTVAGAKIDELKEQLDVLGSAKVCPYCQSAGKDWKNKLETVLRNELDPLEAEQKSRRDNISKLETAIAKTEKRYLAFEEAVRINAGVHDELKRLRTEKENLKERESKDATRIEELEQEKAGLSILPLDPDLKAELATNDEELEKLSGQMAGLDAKKKAETELQQDLKRAAQAELEHQDAAAHVAVIKKVAELLKEKREAMVTEAFNNLLTIANKVVGGILKSPLDLHDGVIGRWDNSGKFITHRVFSGVEKKLTYVAIAIALSAQSPFKLVMIDELGLATPKVRDMVMTRLDNCIEEGIIDQAIVVIPSDKPLKIPGWTMVTADWEKS